jgi:hypothetical protein
MEGDKRKAFEKRVSNLAFYSCGGFTTEELMRRLGEKNTENKRCPKSCPPDAIRDAEPYTWCEEAL